MDEEWRAVHAQLGISSVLNDFRASGRRGFAGTSALFPPRALVAAGEHGEAAK
jgi:hypothetical protein